MRILVIGGDGFMGSHVVDCLVERGHQVSVFDRCPYDVTKNLGHLEGKVQIISGEFANRHELRNAARGHEVLFHFVWASTPISSWNDPHLEIEENLRLSVQLTEVAAEEGVRKLVFPSSGGTVYGAQPNSTTSEDTMPQPFCPYGIAKLAAEHFLNYFRHITGLASDTYRIANAFGPRQSVRSPQGVIPVWMSKILSDSKITVYGDRTTLRDYVYVKDIAHLMMHSLEDLDRSETLNIGSGRGTSIMELLEIFKRVIGLPFQYETLARRPSDNTSIVLDNSRIRSHFPGFQFSDLEEKIAETWGSFRRGKEGSGPR
jgi:UDP-glucose 4-epimerase